jgi:hypothetical protein
MVGTAAIGGPLLGLIADAFDARAPIVLGGVASLAAGAWGFMASRRANRAHETCTI